jgi:hypothetical protein
MDVFGGQRPKYTRAKAIAFAQQGFTRRKCKMSELKCVGLMDFRILSLVV